MTTMRTRSASYTHAELSCLYCGHETTAPSWDAHGVPRCPRCAARLFIEFRDRRPRAHVASRMSRRRTSAKMDEKREDVYVGAPEIAD